MLCLFDWIWSGVTVQGVHIACTIAQTKEFATLHGNVFIQALTAPSAAAGAAAPGRHRRRSRQWREGLFQGYNEH